MRDKPWKCDKPCTADAAAECFVEKVGQGQKLCNCVNSLILEGYSRAEGRMETGLWSCFDRPQPYLCCGQI